MQFEADGTMTVLLGGQVPIVIGGRFQPISVENFTPAGAVNPGAPPSVRIVDSEGRDITGILSQGELGGLLRVRSEVLPALVGDASQNGSLNELAQHLADRVNDILTNGQVSAGPPPEPGVELFSYDSSNGADVARTLSLNPAISAGPTGGYLARAALYFERNSPGAGRPAELARRPGHH